MIRFFNKGISILLINILLFGTFFVSPSFLLFLFRRITNTSIEKKTDVRVSYPTYPDKEQAKGLFNQGKKGEYRAHIGWKRYPINLPNTKILTPYNHRLSLGEDLNDSTWFFGGSTIWGTGVTDESTIPSIYHKLTGKSVFNFGETAWIAKQSLNQLIILIGDGHKPFEVVFYDGANDVYFGCNKNVKTIPTSAREREIRKAIKNNYKAKYMVKTLFNKGTKRILEPYVLLKKYLNRNNLKPYSGYDCHKNIPKARKIATHLVNDWYTGYLIAKEAGAKVNFILQPVLFTSKTNYKYFSKQEFRKLPNLKLQFETVYPLILSEINKKCKINKDFCNSFFDGSKWINDPFSKVFIDFAHLSDKGNNIVVKKFISEK